MKPILRYLPIVTGLVLFVALCSMGAGSCNANGPTVGNNVCLQCHNGKLAPSQLQFPQSPHSFLQCEFCHGSGFAHVRNGGRGGLYITNPAKLPFDQGYQVCKQCHGGEVDQYVLSDHALDKVAKCFDCHNIHVPGAEKLPSKDNSMCLQCHALLGFDTPAKIMAHTHHPYDPAGTGASRCVGCHVVPLRRTDQATGPHNHTFMPIPPITSALQAEAHQPVLPNSCAGTTGCHDGSVPTAPIFNVDDPATDRLLQTLYDTWFPQNNTTKDADSD